VVQCLPSVNKALGSIPSTENEGRKEGRGGNFYSTHTRSLPKDVRNFAFLRYQCLCCCWSPVERGTKPTHPQVNCLRSSPWEDTLHFPFLLHPLSTPWVKGHRVESPKHPKTSSIPPACPQPPPPHSSSVKSYTNPSAQICCRGYSFHMSFDTSALLFNVLADCTGGGGCLLTLARTEIPQR
jgi:hypothetical protein